MKKSDKDIYGLKDKTELILKVNYIASLISAVLGIICFFALDIRGVIPYAFIVFAFLNFVNALLFHSHKNLMFTYNMATVLSMIGAVVVTLFSGGIQSPFIFVLAIIVFAGYVATRVYGQIYLIINMVILVLLFLYEMGDFKISTNDVPMESRAWFAFLSIVFAVYLLGGVFGKSLLKAHHKFYESRNEIQKRIEEKETLLKEVHHRVKNNLQTVSSLLSLQARAISDDKMSSIVKSSQNRVVSMAMVHEMLYKRDDYLSKIELRPYVKELCDYLVRSVRGSTDKIDVRLEIDDLKLSIDTIIPLGLIINETITNALKYGITEEVQGKILVSVKKIGDNRYEMFLGDNGKGYSEEIGPKTTKSLGLKLIYNLSRQLRGSIERDYSKKGTYYRIEFEEIVEGFNSVD